MAATKAKASIATGIDDPTLSVPGMYSSRTIFMKRNAAVVGA